jgi:hypothetical protein
VEGRVDERRETDECGRAIGNPERVRERIVAVC